MAVLFGVRFGTGGLNFSLHIGMIIHLVPTVKAFYLICKAWMEWQRSDNRRAGSTDGGHLFCLCLLFLCPHFNFFPSTIPCNEQPKVSYLCMKAAASARVVSLHA